ncbi:hypothetical protein D3C75_1365770 [compost metagenome]
MRLSMASCLIPTLPLASSIRLMIPLVIAFSSVACISIPSIWAISCPSWLMVISAWAWREARPSSNVRVSVL